MLVAGETAIKKTRFVPLKSLKLSEMRYELCMYIYI